MCPHYLGQIFLSQQKLHTEADMFSRKYLESAFKKTGVLGRLGFHFCVKSACMVFLSVGFKEQMDRTLVK
jgi:hypothetical protein